MRLDKYLKVSRIIKRRTVAKDACDGGKVKINGRSAKPGAEVKPGDLLELSFGSKVITAKVLATPNSISANMAHETYEILEEKRIAKEEEDF